LSWHFTSSVPAGGQGLASHILLRGNALSPFEHNGQARLCRCPSLSKDTKITGLHFHDLRREAASRWMDAGVSLGTIQRWLGHANVAQTSTYLGASLGNDGEDMQAF
jgi:integrase